MPKKTKKFFLQTDLGKIFGDESNDLINQRLFGEVHLDDFDVTHTKDNIQWQGEEEDQVTEELRARISDLIGEAKTTKKARAGRNNEAQEITLAISQVKEEMMSPEMADKLNFIEIPAAEAIRKSLESIIQPIVDYMDPDLIVEIGSLKVWAYVTRKNLGPNDPYVIAETSSLPNKVITIINMAHPHVEEITNQENLTTYLKHCIYDSVAEWMVRSKQAKIDPDSVKLTKDQLLRVRFEIQEHNETP